jgi:putative membrane protein
VTKPALILALTILLAGFGLNACNRSDSVQAARETDSAADRRDMLTAEDKDFIEYASEMHTGEIDMAKQAKDKSNNEAVRDYADTVIRAHTDALKDLGRVRDASLSRKASEDTKLHMEFLSTLPEAQFNREFIALMIADHRDARDTFREELKVTQNADLKDYLQEVEGTLNSRLDGAEQTRSKLTTHGTN